MAGTRRSVESSLSPAPEQDPPEPAGLDSGSELSELTDEEAETLNARPRNWSRRRRRRRYASRRGGRKKRSSLVPAPMWGWVEKNAAEEEEELSEPPRAMEEEEDIPDKEQNDEPDKTLEDDDDDDDDEEEEEEEEEPQPDNETESDNDEEDDEPKPDDEDDDKADLLPTVDDPTRLVTNAQLSPPPSPSSSSEAKSTPSSRAPSPAPIQEDAIARRIDIKSKLSLSRIEDDVDTCAQNDKSVDVDAVDLAQDDAQEDVDVDEPVLEDDLDTELDLQPAHRAEALDELAIIELKFALLRERLYVEKMQTLAWEETLVDSGTHPELLHIQKELSKRRDKRLELATRKRTYEIANVHKRRRIDENATWSWWKHARDDLQIEMIAEANRKRRRLERERRVVERPQPVRRIPNFPVEIPIPPSVRTLVDSYMRTDHQDDGPQTLVYPQLTSLSASDITNDLDFFALHRQSMYDSPRNATSQMGPAPLPPPPIGYDYNESFPPALTANRPPLSHPGFHHPQAPQQQQMVGPGQAPFSYNNGPGRPPPSQHHSAPAIHAATSFPVDQDPSWPLPGPPGGAAVGYSPHSFPARRSMSPPAVKGNGQWMGVGGFHMNKVENEEDERREKRERGQQEIDRDRQRAYHLESLQQQHRHGPSIHQHAHNGPPPPPPPPPPQGHHHHGRHHHHVLHHHPPPPNGPALSPRASREIETGRHPTEIINLSSSKSHWKDEYREKRPGSATASIMDDRERPLAMPFTMSASHHSPPHPPGVSSPPLNSWNQDEMYRPPMSHDSSDRYGRMGSLSERPRTLPPPSPSSSSVPLHYASPSSNPARSPTRYRERSPPLKVHRPSSPKTLPPLSTPVSRVSSPLLSRGLGDRVSDRDQLHSPRPPSKMTVNQMID